MIKYNKKHELAPSYVRPNQLVLERFETLYKKKLKKTDGMF